MTNAGDALGRIATDLDELGVGWALVGGVALNAYGAAWPCRDIDIATAPAGDVAVSALADGLHARGHLVMRVPHDKLGEAVVVHPRIPGAAPLGVLVDLLPCACGFEAEIVAAARRMTVHGVEVPVARPGHLIAFKVRAMHDVRRARDRRHLRALLCLADDDERQLARQALWLSIARRRSRPDSGAMTDAAMADGFFRLLDDAEIAAGPGDYPAGTGRNPPVPDPSRAAG